MNGGSLVPQARLTCGCAVEHGAGIVNVFCETHRIAFFEQHGAEVRTGASMRETVAFGPLWAVHAWNAVERGGKWSVMAGDASVVSGLPKEVACRLANRHNDAIKRVHERAKAATTEAS